MKEEGTTGQGSAASSSGPAGRGGPGPTARGGAGSRERAGAALAGTDPTLICIGLPSPGETLGRIRAKFVTP